MGEDGGLPELATIEGGGIFADGFNKKSGGFGPLHVGIELRDVLVEEVVKLAGLAGDKAVSVVFDNSKIKRFVPGYCATVPFGRGVRETMAWFDADPGRKQIDTEANATWDRLVDAYEAGTREALRRFQA